MDAKLLDKMNKLLNLASDKRGNENECAVAMGQLNRLLTEHNLSMADLETRGQAKAQTAVEQGIDLGKAAWKWKLELAQAVAEHYYCVALVRNKSPIFVGRPDNVESLKGMYVWLIGQIQQISATERKSHAESTGEHVPPLRWQLNFGLGIVERLARRLAEDKRKHAEETARDDMGDVVAMTVSRTREANDYLETTYGYRKDGQRTKQEQADLARYNAQELADKSLLASDPDAYYRKFPWKHPVQVEKNRKEWAAEQAKEYAEREKREEKNAKRRKGPTHRAPSPEQMRREAQASDAKWAGRDAADKINLTPFVTSGAKKGILE